ncbi:hypothetical protein [Sphingomonas sp. SUN039]|uniref:hypothetical protein n=1 Tax=Sphingomonas sp. SUN039 TaxID=2937787 RepID=UPI0021649FB6|nr:hypothetical protein [Sphingomonas sp. SUN039]UVO52624.1 hypothetical protein M0209_00240 [Sphingomonas sp. SUN039]
MSFFGSVFAALTMYRQWDVTGVALVLPFLIFAATGLAATHIIRVTGRGSDLSESAQRVVMWSSIAEGIGLFLAGNIVVNLHRPDLLLPAMAMIVGLHFLPIAHAALFRPFYMLGAVLIVAAVGGFALGPPTGGTVAGLTAAISLWVAAALAVRRGWGA